MVFFFEIPIILIAMLVFGILGINLVSIISWIATISLVVLIIAFFFSDGAEGRIISLVMIALNIGLLFFLDGKHLDLYDILVWLF